MGARPEHSASSPTAKTPHIVCCRLSDAPHQGRDSGSRGTPFCCPIIHEYPSGEWDEAPVAAFKGRRLQEPLAGCQVSISCLMHVLVIDLPVFTSLLSDRWTQGMSTLLPNPKHCVGLTSLYC